jgi:hypothetical protein
MKSKSGKTNAVPSTLEKARPEHSQVNPMHETTVLRERPPISARCGGTYSFLSKYRKSDGRKRGDK